MIVSLGALVPVVCPRCSREDDGEVVEVRDNGEVFVACPACDYVFEHE